MISIVDPCTYDCSVHTVFVRDINIKIENLSPQLSDKERIEKRRYIEESLFDIFCKYNNI